MRKPQITQIFTDIDDVRYDYDKWIWPDKISYIVLKDNSIIRMAPHTMLYFDGTSQNWMLYVANGIRDNVNKTYVMPEPGVVHPDNVKRMVSVVTFRNINHVVMVHPDNWFGGGI